MEQIGAVVQGGVVKRQSTVGAMVHACGLPHMEFEIEIC